MTFAADFFRNNRRRLAAELKGGLVVLAGYDAMQQTNDQAAPFVQEANFWYLTGVVWPKWKMMYDGTRDTCWLIEPKRSATEVLFEGEPDRAAILEASGTDEIISEDDISTRLIQAARSHTTVYTFKNDTRQSYVNNPAQRRLAEQLQRVFTATLECDKDMRRLRAIKQPEELRAIKRAVAVTSEAYAYIRDHRSDYQYEYEIEADLWRIFRAHNAQHAYAPIVASGNNATTLHYDTNAARLKKNQLVLMDFGARAQHYCADITRVLALDEPTDYQRTAYDALLRAQRQMIRLIKPGYSLHEYQLTCDAIMSEALETLGLGRDEATLRTYFPHAVSHGLGIDVHDTLGGYADFQPGMVLTVEPGIYIPAKKLGLRIEDNIAVTQHGTSNLSAAITTEL